ncbi:hypothetical protein EDB89DRAFT_2069319 [Lactarius sanguifluus]|nr:hypothetical protein EDB89DRAFT_2069319 [Lactarius sanguifluus]
MLSTPCLQTIYFQGISYPALPTLLLSTNGLVSLSLRDIPLAGYVSEVMVACLAALPRLISFSIEFQSATTSRFLLSYFRFDGASEYLEVLVARIDSPRLIRINLYYLNQHVAVDSQALKSHNSPSSSITQ